MSSRILGQSSVHAGLLLSAVALAWVSFAGAPPAQSQADPPFTWVRTIVPAGMMPNGAAYDNAFDSEGNLIAGGSLGTNPGGSPQNVFTVAKYDREGNQVWLRQPAGANGRARTVAVDSQDAVIAGGSAGQPLLIKWDKNGAMAWSIAPPFFPASIVTDSSGDIIAGGGMANNDWAVAKFRAPNGSLAWMRQGNGGVAGTNSALSVAVDGSGHVAAGGYGQTGGGPFGFLVMRLNGATGAPFWTKYDGDPNEFEQVSSVAMNAAGDVIAGGYFTVTGQRFFTVAKYAAATGVRQWINQTVGGATPNGRASAVGVKSNGDAVATGFIEPPPDGDEIETGAAFGATNGARLWETFAPGEGDRGFAFADAGVVDANNNLISSGGKGSYTPFFEDFTVWQRDPGGNLVKTRSHPSNGQGEALSVAVDRDGNIGAAGYVTDPKSGQVQFTVAYAKVEPPGGATHLAITAPPSAVIGVPFDIEVTALTASNAVAANYRGRVSFTSSKAAVVNPSPYTFTAADAGVHRFRATLTSLGAQTITVTDPALPTPSAVANLQGLESAPLVVTTDADTVSSVDGLISLREAILFANGKPGRDTISFNIPGAGVRSIRPTSALPTIGDPVVIDGFTQPGASPNTKPPTQGINAVLLIEINGQSVPAGNNGLTITAGDCVVRGLAINRFQAVAAPGGANGGVGIRVLGAGGNTVSGCFVGTDVAGSTALENAIGLAIHTANNQIGGESPGMRNLISGQKSLGIQLTGAAATGNRVLGNYVGLDATGTRSLPNTTGIGIFSADNIIGGPSASARNVISGNKTAGVSIATPATNNSVQGNAIGVSAPVDATVPNQFGVAVTASSGNVIGGAQAAAGNVIGGNTGSGVYLVADGNTVQRNSIGTDAAGAVALSNLTGVTIRGERNSIGGTTAGAGNRIARNTGAGIVLDQPQALRNTLIGNTIHANGGLGIDLKADGVSPNDGADGDTGPNDLQNFPTIASATVRNGAVRLNGKFRSKKGAQFRLDFYSCTQVDPSGHGEGETYLGNKTVAMGMKALEFNASFPAPANAASLYFTATASRIGPDFFETSEFGPAVKAGPLAAKFNFQPADAPPFAGYVTDDGSRYGTRNGYLHGWNAPAAAGAVVDRNSARAPDQRYDTLIHMQKFGKREWELAVPNGRYRVKLVAGDPDFFDSVYRIDVEGLLALKGTPTAAKPFIEDTITVRVKDGRLTIGNATGAKNNKLCFVEIERL